jgi:Na+-transporting NADH:ubiquinone oxidoreductase subunit NqrB
MQSKTMAKKCRQCELVNWEHDEVCKRCGASLNPATPPVYKWFVLYCVVMALLYLLAAVMGVVFLFIEPDRDMSALEAKIMGSLFLILGFVFFGAYALAPFLPRKSWVWVFGLVLICIGLTSACCLPVCIPLLIFWLKPEMKAFYGRTLNPLPPPLPPRWS